MSPKMRDPEEPRAAIPAAVEAAREVQTAAAEAVDAAAEVAPIVEQAAVRVEAAAEQLADVLDDTATDLKPTTRTRLCPHCRAALIPHGDANPHKAGAYHCNACGSCWAPGLHAQRAGHAGPGGV